MGSKLSHLTLDERREIERWRHPASEETAYYAKPDVHRPVAL